MADRTIKPDSGNDLVLQNDDASAKVEINEDGSIILTGTPQSEGEFQVGTNLKFKDQGTGSAQTNLIELGHSASGDILKFVNAGSTDALISLTDGGVFTVHSGSECDVQNATFTTSSAQKQAIVDPVQGGLMAVGTVSESSGTPTGDIIQKGSNSNGEYIRYADGTQICWNTGILSSASSDVTWTFPISFKASTLNNIFGIVNDADRVVTLSANNSTTVTSVNFRAWGLRSSNYTFRSGANCMLCAIGRWY